MSNRITTRYLNSPASSPPPAEGFEVVWQRAAAMIVALTERQPSKILHIYPCEKFTKYLSEVRYIVRSILLPVYSRTGTSELIEHFSFSTQHSIFDVEGLAENDSNEVLEEDR